MSRYVVSLVGLVLLAGCTGGLIEGSGKNCPPLGNGGVDPVADTDESIRSQTEAEHLIDRVNNSTRDLPSVDAFEDVTTGENLPAAYRSHMDQSNTTDYYSFRTTAPEASPILVSSDGTVYVVYQGDC